MSRNVAGDVRQSVHPSRRFCAQCGCRKGYSASSNRSARAEAIHHHESLRCFDCDAAPGPVRFEGSDGTRLPALGGLPGCGAWDQEARESLDGGCMGLGAQSHVRFPTAGTPT